MKQANGKDNSLPKYWVAPSNMEFLVITDAWDSIGGNYYRAVKDGFITEDKAQEYADKLNKGELE